MVCEFWLWFVAEKSPVAPSAVSIYIFLLWTKHLRHLFKRQWPSMAFWKTMRIFILKKFYNMLKPRNPLPKKMDNYCISFDAKTHKKEHLQKKSQQKPWDDVGSQYPMEGIPTSHFRNQDSTMLGLPWPSSKLTSMTCPLEVGGSQLFGW